MFIPGPSWYEQWKKNNFSSFQGKWQRQNYIFFAQNRPVWPVNKVFVCYILTKYAVIVQCDGSLVSSESQQQKLSTWPPYFTLYSISVSKGTMIWSDVLINETLNHKIYALFLLHYRSNLCKDGLPPVVTLISNMPFPLSSYSQYVFKPLLNSLDACYF